MKRISALLFLTAFVFTSLLSYTSATPGQGVIAIYYQTPWAYPITVFYEADGLPWRNITMQRYYGPEHHFEHGDYRYVEIGANEITSLYFQNSSNVKDTRNGTMWSFDNPGVFAVYNDTSNETLSYYWDGCPGQPADYPLEYCSSHGACDLTSYECNCDPGWSCPACECDDSCRMVQQQTVRVGHVNLTIPQVYESRACCTQCNEHNEICAVAVYDYTTFECKIYGNYTLIENVTLGEELLVALIYPAKPPPKPPLPSTGNGGSNGMSSTRLYIYVGASLGIALVIGLLAVRMVTSERRTEAVERMLAQKKQDELEASANQSSNGGLPFEGKYRVIRELGRGAFGVVYLVVKRSNGRDATNTASEFSATSPSGSPRPLTRHGSTVHPQDRTLQIINTHQSSSPMMDEVDGEALAAEGGSEHVLVTHRSGQYSPTITTFNYTSVSQQQQFFAMKVIHCHSEEELMAAFKEYQSISKLKGHPNIVNVTDMFMSCESSAAVALPPSKNRFPPHSQKHLLHHNGGRNGGALSAQQQEERKETMRSLQKLEQDWLEEQRLLQGCGALPKSSYGGSDDRNSSGDHDPHRNHPPSSINRQEPDAHAPLLSSSDAAAAHHYHQEGEGDDEQDSSISAVAPTRYLSLVMQFYPEGTLEDALRTDAQTMSQGHRVIQLTQQILSAIAFSHKKNLIHRDLKPGNVLLSGNRTHAIVTDFGLARDLEKSATEAAGVGTLHFLAPEQLEHRVSKKSDIWSIACIAVAMATARAGVTKTLALFMLRNSPEFERSLYDALVGASAQLTVGGASLSPNMSRGTFSSRGPSGLDSPSLAATQAGGAGLHEPPLMVPRQESADQAQLSPTAATDRRTVHFAEKQQPCESLPSVHVTTTPTEAEDPTAASLPRQRSAQQQQEDDEGDDHDVFDPTQRFVCRPAPPNHVFLPSWFASLLLRMLQPVSIDRPTAEECLQVMDTHCSGGMMMMGTRSPSQPSLMLDVNGVSGRAQSDVFVGTPP